MAANTVPIFPLTPNVGVMNVLLSTAMTSTKAFEGTDTPGTALALCFTAGANGARVDSIKVKHSGTTGAAPSGTTSATVLNVFLNNGSANTTAANNQLIGSIAVAAQAITSVAAMNEYTLPLNISIPAGYKVYVGNTTAVGGTTCALAVSVQGGDY